MDICLSFAANETLIIVLYCGADVRGFSVRINKHLCCSGLFLSSFKRLLPLANLTTSPDGSTYLLRKLRRLVAAFLHYPLLIKIFE